MIKKGFTICFFLLFALSAKPTTLSDSLRFSVLTVSPGNELYSVFGHTGIRLTDLKNNHDIVFNYGTFDFRTPNFYLKFAQGVLDYQLAIENFNDFINGNSYENRAVCEQVLDLNPQQSLKLAQLLLENLLPQNRKYRYKFFTDNCATRPRDIIVEAYNAPDLLRNPEIESQKAFRTLFTSYLSQMPWGQFGTELLLGKMTDNKAGYDALFLPDNLMLALNKAEIEGKVIVKTEVTLLTRKTETNANAWFTPIILALILLALSFIIQLKPLIAKYFDYTFFTFTGILGLFVTVLSSTSHHAELHYNFVILFFFPMVILIPYIKGKYQNTIGLLCFTIIVLSFLLLPILPQSFNLAVLLLSAALAVRLFFNFAFPKLKSIFYKK